MAYLDNVTTSNAKEGVRIVIAGAEKVGKTTMVAGAPGALLVPLEIGYAGIQIAKTPMIQKYDAFELFMGEVYQSLCAGSFQYNTIIFDSATALERMIHDSVLRLDPGYEKGTGNKKAITMESALGGYGRAYTFANERFDRFLKWCDMLAVQAGINIVLTCHTFASKIIDPAQGEYDSWDLLLHSPKNNKTYGKREMLTQWADVIGFLYEPIYITKEQGSNVAKGISANKGRVMGLSRTPSYVAGNRFGVVGEISIPKEQGWNYFAHSIYQSCGVDLYNRG